MPPAKNPDLHGFAPDACPVALLLIDWINDLEFEGGRRLLKPAVRAADRVAALKKRARDGGIPVIYANDNFGRWRSNFGEVVQHCLVDGVAGRPLAERLMPGPDDYFVLKPKHSAFFSTALDTLLKYLRVERLILTGITADMCVLITAVDAHMRDFDINVPQDCTASMSTAVNREALRYMARVPHADMTPSAKLDLRKLVQSATRQKKIKRRAKS
jgi:nicotinamidase-related amidase